MRRLLLPLCLLAATDARAPWEGLFDPLVLDLDGDGVHTVPVAYGPAFDLFGTGKPLRVGWVAPGDAFLVFDENDNGVVDDGRELFSEVTGGTDWSDGFSALASLDANDDGLVDARDKGFARLRLWQDKNGDGRGDAREWKTMAEAGIAALDLHPQRARGGPDRSGNWVPLKSHFIRADGSRGVLADVDFRYAPLPPSMGANARR